MRRLRVFLMVMALCACVGMARAAGPDIALMPLDNRPPCLDHALRLGAIAGAGVRVPPYSAMGAYVFAGHPRALAQWLQTLSPSPEYLIVSLDMLAYGGLVASRRNDTSLAQAREGLAALRAFAAAHPRTQIYAFSIIQRIARTATGEPGADHVTDLISQYVALLDEADARDDAALRAKAQELKNKIPKQQLDDYLAARARNHAMNLAAVDLAAEGVVQYLVLAMDDNAEYGPHRPERNALAAAARASGAADRVLIKPGADEVAQLLLARAVNRARGVQPRIALHFFPPDAAQWIPPLEDRALAAMAEASLHAAGATVATDKRIHAHLIVYAGDGPGGSAPDAARDAVALAARLARQGRAAGVADVRFVNRADPMLAQRLLDAVAPAELTAYAGWNTAGNAFGTAAAHLNVAYALRRDAQRGARDLAPRAAAHAAFLLQRFIDDNLYMAGIRPDLEMQLRAQGASPFNIPYPVYKEMRKNLAAQLHQKARVLFVNYFRGAILNLGLPPEADGLRIRDMTLNFLIPWFRMFEIDAAVTCDVAPAGR